MPEFITTHLCGRVFTITIVRPGVRNALHPPACQEIGAALDQFEASPDASIAIITGEGEMAFCAGFDLKFAEQHPEVYQDPLIGSEITRRKTIGKPLIAAVNGLALGLGFELALACDLIIAARHAKFSLPEPRVGLAAMAGGVVRLSRDLGLKRALGIVLTGRMVSAEEGSQLGFVNEVAADSVMACARRWASGIAEGAPLSLIASKEMAYRSRDLAGLEAALDPRSYPAVERVLESDDAIEGRRAFLENRKPQWKGR